VRVGIRLLLAEDHQIVRRNLRTLLQDHEGWQVVAEAGDGCEAVRLAEAHRPDVAVIGLAMLVLNGIETTRRTVEGSDPVTESGFVTHKIPGIGDTRRGILIEYCSL
jgi:DNA-binding NarL/FixJ family response regulator